MSLEKLYWDIDNREEGQVLNGFNLEISPDELHKVFVELSAVSLSDIPPKYRQDITRLLESNLFLPDFYNLDIKSSLEVLLYELRE